MATVTVLKFPSAHGAEEGLLRIQNLQKQHLLELQDAALVSWPAGRKGPSTKQLANVVTTGPLGGVFWGMLFGLIFFTPLFGLAIGVAVGTLGGVFRDYGIDDGFIRRVRSALTEGTSALFLMTNDVVADRVVEALMTSPFDVMATKLTKDQERQLREAFVHH